MPSYQRRLGGSRGSGELLPAKLEYIDVIPAQPDEESESGVLLQYWRLLRSRKGTLLAIALLGAGAGLAVALLQTPVYQARAQLEIQEVNENFMNMRSVEPAASFGSYSAESHLQTQIKILQSEPLKSRALGKLRNGVESPYAPSRVRQWLKGAEDWAKSLGLPVPPPPSPRQSALQLAADTMKARAAGTTRIVELLCDSTDPALATAFLNAVSDEFIDQNMATRWDSAQRTRDWLNRQLLDVKNRMESSNAQLQSYAQSSGLVYTGDAMSVAEQKLRKLQEELASAEADRVMKESKYEIAASAKPDSLPDVLNHTALRDYQAKLTELRRQEAEYDSSFKPTYYRVQRLQAQIGALEHAIESERNNIMGRIRNEFQAAQRREKLLGAAYQDQARIVADQAAKAVHYNTLKREVDGTRQLYDTMLQRVKEADIASALHVSSVRVIEPARAPAAPYKPDWVRNLLLGLVAGTFLGPLIVFVRERMNVKFKAPGEASLALKVPELAVVPTAALCPAPAAPGRGPLGLFASNGGKRAWERRNSSDTVELMTWSQGQSLVAESFRAALPAILYSDQELDRPRVIVVASALSNEGKTSVVSNLGIALAEVSRRVLLIDADMQRPRLHTVFDLANTWGLSNLLREKMEFDSCSLEALAKPTQVPDLFVLPSGPGTVSISKLLYSSRITELLGRLRKEFDVVLIDTPPALHFSDARAVARWADAVILVIRSGATPRDAAAAVRQRFSEDGRYVLGTILNDWNPKVGYGYYNDYYRHYYAHYDGPRPPHVSSSAG